MSRTQHSFQIYRATLFCSTTKKQRHFTRVYKQWSCYYYVYSSPNLSRNIGMHAEQQDNEPQNIIFAVSFRQRGWVRSLHISDGKPPDCAISMTLIDITRLAHGNLNRCIKIIHALQTGERLPRKSPKTFVGPHLAQIVSLGNEAQCRCWDTTKCLCTICGFIPCVSANVTEAISIIQCSAIPSSNQSSTGMITDELPLDARPDVTP